MSREADLYKDKIEVSLDGRQIFYLFFGGAVIVGLVFVLGVMVGRRVEARGHVDRARTTAAVDPLAALDRLEDKNLSFKGSLMGTPAATSDVEQAIGALAQQRKPDAKKHDKPAEVVVDKPADKPADMHVDKSADKQIDKSADKPVTKPSDKSLDKPADKPADKPVVADKPADKPVTKPTDKIVADKPADKAAVDKPVTKPSDKPTDKPSDKAKPAEQPADKLADKPKQESKYTLQLSSFQDKAEADAFLATLKAQGYSPHVTEATVTGKTWYRIRMGTYKSVDAANEAKAEFEKTAKKSASVMKL